LESLKKKPQSNGDHYSIEVYKDAQIAEAFDQEKFGSPIGKLFKKYQEEPDWETVQEISGREHSETPSGPGE